MTRDSRQAIIARALELLQGGTLPSTLPGRLMAEFGLTPDRARQLAGAALKRYKADSNTRF